MYNQRLLSDFLIKKIETLVGDFKGQMKLLASLVLI